MGALKEKKALELKEKIKSLCKEYNQWVTVTYEHKPELRMIALFVSIKVDNA